MKKAKLTPIICCILVIVLSLVFSACGKTLPETDVWSEAVYTEDTELGDGEKTVFVEVVAEEKSITFTIHSNKETLGEALMEHNLLEGENGAYGLYVKKVNGITADYDKIS